MTGCEEVKEFVQRAAEGLSNNPSEVRTTIADQSGSSLCILIQCRNNGSQDTDVGLIVGKQGRNIRAIRTLAESIGAKHKLRPTLIVKE